jgi:hypothetical protein
MALAQHLCRCGKTYDCPYCHTPNSFACPTINEDEDANMCDECLDKMVTEMLADLDNLGDFE